MALLFFTVYSFVILPVFPTRLLAQSEDSNQADVFGKAREYLCTKEGSANIDVNGLFENLKKIIKNKDLPNVVMADAYSYQGSILAQYPSTRDKAIALFKKALTLNPRLSMCEDNPALDLFKQVVGVMYDSAAPDLDLDRKNSEFLFKTNQLKIVMRVQNEGETAFSAVKATEFFYFDPVADKWMPLSMDRDSKDTTYYSVIIPLNLLNITVEDHFVFYVRVADQIGNEGFFGTKDDPYDFILGVGPQSAELTSILASKKTPKKEEKPVAVAAAPVAEGKAPEKPAEQPAAQTPEATANAGQAPAEATASATTPAKPEDAAVTTPAGEKPAEATPAPTEPAQAVKTAEETAKAAEAAAEAAKVAAITESEIDEASNLSLADRLTLASNLDEKKTTKAWYKSYWFGGTVAVLVAGAAVTGALLYTSSKDSNDSNIDGNGLAYINLDLSK
jgi:hypothetical protein